MMKLVDWVMGCEIIWLVCCLDVGVRSPENRLRNFQRLPPREFSVCLSSTRIMACRLRIFLTRASRRDLFHSQDRLGASVPHAREEGMKGASRQPFRVAVSGLFLGESG